MENRQLGGDGQRHLVVEMGDKELPRTAFQGQADIKPKQREIGHMIDVSLEEINKQG